MDKVKVEILAEEKFPEILDEKTIQFLIILNQVFESRRVELLERRVARQREISNGKLPDFLPETRHIRENLTWRAAPPSPGLADRRVEITGPVDRKMVINALNSNASTFMADFEDSNCPTWSNNLNGQINLRDANLRTISFTAKETGKFYRLNTSKKIPALLVRPRGWHMVEKHFLIDGKPISASIFDFGIYFLHNAKQTIKNGHGPYFYLPKMESHLEARLWNDIFNAAQDMVGVPRGTIRATVLIETILAAFEMDEIIYELREHSAGLNCGRWDYIFSFIKKFKDLKEFVLPPRNEVTMETPFMDAYVRLLIKTCHQRGVHAMGGMAAQIPIKGDAAANSKAMQKVQKDKLREVLAGHDGTWVAHPDLVKVALDIFNQHMPTPNQIHVRCSNVTITAKDLLAVPPASPITIAALELNISIGLEYMESWLRGIGCVPIHNLMEDAATAEISRSQIWQWTKHHVKLNDGTVINKDLVIQVVDREVQKAIKARGPKPHKYVEAGEFLKSTVVGERHDDFLTTLCYDSILTIKKAKSKL